MTASSTGWRTGRTPGVEQQLADGNATELVKVDDNLIARSFYEDLADEKLPVRDALPALVA
jgi:hypothetical protein